MDEPWASHPLELRSRRERGVGAMPKIAKSREVHAGVDAVWEVLTDAAQEQRYWTAIRDVRVLRADGRTIEREATVGPRAFSQRSRQTITLEPKTSIKLTMVGESMKGERTIDLVPLGEEGVRVDVEWDLEVQDVPGFVQGLVANQISGVTERALELIAEDAERKDDP